VLDPGFKLISIAAPTYSLMTAIAQAPTDFIQRTGRQAGELGSRASASPPPRRRLARINKGHFRQIRAGETDRPPPRLPSAQQVQRSVLPARGLAIAQPFFLASKRRPASRRALVLACPWAHLLKLQANCTRCRIDKLPGGRLKHQPANKSVLPIKTICGQLGLACFPELWISVITFLAPVSLQPCTRALE